MKYFFTCLLVFIAANNFAQSNYNSESYSVSANDLETNTFKKDSTANALVIYEYGNSFIDKRSFNLKTEIKRKIKILNKDGFNNANVTVYLYNNDSKKKEKIQKIIATTYNLIDGKMTSTKLDKSQIFEEKYNANYTLVKFTMPNTKEGSVFTYSYTIESPFIYKYKGWRFQSHIPKLYSEYNASIPANYEYHIKLVGAKKLAINTSVREYECLKSGNGTADCFNSVYVMKDVPAFVEEDYMTTEDNYLARIDYELKIYRGFDGSIDNITKSWKSTDKELKTSPSIGKRLNKSVASKALIDASIMTEKDPLKKAISIYNYTKENYVWNEKNGLFNETPIKNLIKEKSGSAAEINILLHNLLKANKIEVKPVLLATRGKGIPTRIYPVISDFNYIIVEATINDKTYLLDATDPYLSFGQIPYRCLNQLGRKLDFKNGSSWLSIEANKTSTVSFHLNLAINEDQAITGTLKTKRTGYKALYKKKAYFPNPDDYLDDYENEQESILVNNHVVLNEDKNVEDFNEIIEIELSSDDASADIIYLNPFFYKFFIKNPFRLQERSYPIDFGYKSNYKYVIELDLGDAYEVESIPNGLDLKLPKDSGKCHFSTKTEGQKLIMTFEIVFNRSIYASNYYESLKRFMNRVVDIQTNSLITLKKKN